MSIPATVIGRELPVAEITIERGRVQQFVRAVDESDPIFSDLVAARRGGHPDLPVPPTFLFCADLDVFDPLGLLGALGVDLHRVLHGEQSFVYHAPVHAGETLIMRGRFSDLYTKKGGLLEFLVKQTMVSRPDGTLVAELTSTFVVKNPEAG